MKAADRDDLYVKNEAEVAETLARESASNRGFLSRSQSLLLGVIAIASLFFAPWIAVVVGVLFLADFAVFVGRRARILRDYDAGAPRLTTADDFDALNRVFATRNRRVPSMTDYERAAGLSGGPSYRTDQRYHHVKDFYRGGTVADIGCGDGRLCWRYEICAPELYYGVDAQELVEVLRRKTASRAHGIAGVAEDTSLPDDSMDLVVCSECFEHLVDPGVALLEFCRIAKPGGTIVIQSPSATQLRNLNPFHIVTIFLGRWFPALLQRTVVHEHTFSRSFTYHWDFTRQDFERFARALPVTLESFQGAMYRFNRSGPFWHRLLDRISRLPLVHWLWWDLTVVFRKVGPRISEGSDPSLRRIDRPGVR